jgi:nitrate reductase gamma subunit
MRNLLDFAQNRGLHWAMVVMVAGFCARLVIAVVARPEADLYWARKAFSVPGERWKFDSFAMHIGLFVAIFGFAPHIQLVRAITGLGWHPLPIAVVMFAGAVTVITMLWLLAYRFAEPNLRKLSTVDDYLCWAFVFAPVVTGLAAYPHLGGGFIFSPSVFWLTLHLLSVELLMLYLPFGKLMHLVLMPFFRAALFAARLFNRKSATADFEAGVIQ